MFNIYFLYGVIIKNMDIMLELDKNDLCFIKSKNLKK